MRKTNLNLAARMRVEVQALAEIEAWRAAVEKGIIDAHLAELEAGIAADMSARLRAFDALWRLA